MGDVAYERLSQLDHSFLLFEDSNAHMHVGAVQIHEAAPLRTPEGGLDIDRVRRYVLSRLHLIPRYRQRLARIPLEGHPIWIDDRRFNPLYHVRHTRLPEPGDERLLKRLVGRIMSQQLDRGKPLWEMWVVEGLAEDRCAVVLKTHHCMIDGVSGVDLMSVLMTPEPCDTIPDPPLWRPRPAPSSAELMVGETLRWARAPLDLGSSLWRIARDEDHARHHLVERLRATGRMLATGLRNASNTPLNQSIGPHRRFDWISMDLERLRGVKRRLGGTINDVVLATVTGALQRFLGDWRGLDLRELDFRVMAPVSLRSAQQRGALGNRVSAWIVPLPLAEADPRRRIQRIRQTTGRLKESKQALGADTLTQVTEWTGSTLLALGGRLAARGRPFNLVVTNVPGPQRPLFLLGSQMLEVYPMVPLFGNLATGIALFSYAGTLHWGLMGDWDRVPDLHEFLMAIERSFEELCDAAAALPASARTSRSARGTGPGAARARPRSRAGRA